MVVDSHPHDTDDANSSNSGSSHGGARHAPVDDDVLSEESADSDGLTSDAAEAQQQLNSEVCS